MRFSPPHGNFTTKTESESARAFSCNLGWLCRILLLCTLQGPKWPILQDFCFNEVSGAAKLATKLESCSQGLCFARETTLHRFSWLLHLITSEISGDFSPIFPLFTRLHNKSLFHLKQPRERFTFIFPDSIRARGYFCPNFCKATLDLGSTHAPNLENAKKHEKSLFLRKISVFFAQMRSIGCRYIVKNFH